MVGILLIFGVLILVVLIVYLALFFTTFTEVGEFLCSYPKVPLSSKRVEIESRPASFRALYDQEIPFHIIQTNFKKTIASKFFYTVEHMLALNPEYEYRYFDDEDCKIFLKENYPEEVLECYNILVPGAYKADLFRAAYLYKNGGVYIDSGMYSYIPLRDIIKSDDVFLSVKDNPLLKVGREGYIYNAFIAAKPGNEILANYLQRIITNIKNRDYGNSMFYITGPLALGISFEEVMKKKVMPSHDYGNGIRLLELKISLTGLFDSYGVICYGDNSLIYTKYNGYYSDQKKNNKPHYYMYYYTGQVFGENGILSKTFAPPEQSSFDEIIRPQSLFRDILISDYPLSNKKIESLSSPGIKTINIPLHRNKKQENYLKYLQRINADCEFIPSTDSETLDLDKVSLYPFYIDLSKQTDAFQSVVHTPISV